MTALNLRRARTIVEHAENMFSSGERIEDAFSPFFEGGASSREEARNALLLVIADTYRLTESRAISPSATRDFFESYARSSRFIATRIACDAIRDPPFVEETALKCGREYEAFVAYIRTLKPKQVDFWPAVYEYLGLPCPTPATFLNRLMRRQS